MMHYYGWRYPAFGWGTPTILGFIFSILFWVLVALVIASFVRWVIDDHHDHHSRDDRDESDRLLSILKERYAKGEITKKVFEEMRDELEA